MLLAAIKREDNHFENDSKNSGKSNKDDFQEKYKTEICKNWVNGHCQFANSCAFAHGKDELRNKTNLPKTKECKHFSEVGFCAYGERCQFKHTLNVKPRLPVFIKISLKGQLEP